MKTLKFFLRFSLFIYPLLLLYGCEKNEGKVYLRVINSIPVSANITVTDSEQKIAVDGKYHQVYNNVKTNYTLLNVVYDSVLNWTPGSNTFHVLNMNKSLSRYFGEFEKIAGDSYYTLTLRYKVEYSPIFNLSDVLFPNAKMTQLKYSDVSKLVTSSPE